MKNGVVLTGWAPFNGENGQVSWLAPRTLLSGSPTRPPIYWLTLYSDVIVQSLLGEIDLAFLGTYAVAMFFAGHIGDRVDLRLFLSIGMLGSGVFTALFGVVSSRGAGVVSVLRLSRAAMGLGRALR